MTLRRYFKFRHRYVQAWFEPSRWTGFDAYIEVDGQRASRQVNVFDSGHVLRYDRLHCRDDFGGMRLGLFSRKRKAVGDGVEIDTREFERQWRRALRSDLWPEQVQRRHDMSWLTWDRPADGRSRQ